LTKLIASYVILAACNPALAAQAFAAEPLVGTLLPCNVVVMERDDVVTVAAVDASAMMRMLDNRELEPIANDADARLRAALDRLA
jgi:uncharacterized protein (DUF302 family)